MLACENGVHSKLLLNSQELVVLGQPLAAAWGASFDLAGSQSNYEISNERVFSLAGTVRNHHSPTVMKALLSCFDGFGETADLVDLQQQGIACLPFDSLVDALGVCDLSRLCQLPEDHLRRFAGACRVQH